MQRLTRLACRGPSLNRTGYPRYAPPTSTCARPVHHFYRQFSLLASPKKLSDIVRLDLISNESAGRILHIWMEYHAKKESCAAGILSRAEYDVVMFRTKRSPMFILPVKRDAGHFIVVGQFKGHTTLITHLEDYKLNPDAAEPHLTISVHNELVETKDLALVRGDFSHKLRKEEAALLVKEVFRIYFDTAEYKHVEALNARPADFNWEEFIRRQLARAGDDAAPRADAP